MSCNLVGEVRERINKGYVVGPNNYTFGTNKLQNKPHSPRRSDLTILITSSPRATTCSSSSGCVPFSSNTSDGDSTNGAMKGSACSRIREGEGPERENGRGTGRGECSERKERNLPLAESWARELPLYCMSDPCAVRLTSTFMKYLFLRVMYVSIGSVTILELRTRWCGVEWDDGGIGTYCTYP